MRTRDLPLALAMVGVLLLPGCSQSAETGTSTTTDSGSPAAAPTSFGTTSTATSEAPPPTTTSSTTSPSGPGPNAPPPAPTHNETWYLRQDIQTSDEELDQDLGSTSTCGTLGVQALTGPADLGTWVSVEATTGFPKGAWANVTFYIDHDGMGTATLFAKVLQKGATIAEGSTVYAYSGGGQTDCLTKDSLVAVRIPMRLDAPLGADAFSLAMSFTGAVLPTRGRGIMWPSRIELST
ncbi:MAG: hypothetical protein V4510_06615 [bacterium]